VLIVGEPGSGKSRLLREFRIRCQIEGVDLFSGRPGSGSGGGAFLEALAKAARSRGPLSRETLQRHGETLDALCGSGPEGPFTPPPGSPALPADEGPGIFPAVVAVLREIGSQGPLALALDDLHRADETTCALVRHVARAIASRTGDGTAGLPVLLVGTYTGDEVTRSSPLFDLLAEAREIGLGEEIFLDPLSPDEASLLLRSLLGADEIPLPFLERILEETRGNPLFIEELAALLAEEGHVEPGGAAPLDPAVLSRVKVPGKIRDLFVRRLERIEPEPLQVLRASAVLGASAMDADAVAAITGMRWEHVVRQFLELHRAGIAQREEDEGGAPVYRVLQPGLAGLALEAIPPDEARILHGRAFSYLERRGVPRWHAAWASLARHAEAAGLPGRAAEAFGRAGGLAAELHAHHEAIDSYGRAIDLLLRQGEAPTAALCEMYAQRGVAHTRLGDLKRAEEDFRWMLARAEKDGTPALKASAHLALGQVLEVRSQYAEAQENLEIALEIAGRAGDRDRSAEAGIALGRVAARLGQFDDAIARLDRALASATEGGLVGREVEALLAKAAVHRDQGSYRLALACYAEASSRTGGRGRPEVEASIEVGAAEALEIQGKYRDAAEAYGRAREHARERADAGSVAALTARLGTLLLRTGDHEAARREIEEALEARRRLGSREGIARSLQDLALLHLDQGRPEAALETADEALRLARRIGHRELTAISLNLVGGIHLRAGDLERAGALFEEAQRTMRDARSPRWLAVFLQDLGDLRRLEGHPADALRHYQESAFLSRKAGDRRLESRAMVRLGEAHLNENDFDRALVSCRKALSLVETAGLPREEADAKLLRARIELSLPGGDVVRAEIDALDALQRFRDLNELDAAWQAEHVGGKAALRLGRRAEGAARIERCHRYLEGLRSRLGAQWRATFLGDPRRRDLYDEWERLRASAPRDAAAGADEVTGGEFAKLRDEAAALRRLLDINRKLNSVRDTDELLRSILDAAIELTGAERGFLLLADGAEIATRQMRGAVKADGARAVELSRSIARRVIESGEPLLSADAASDERLSTFESVRDLEIRSVLAVPLRIRDEAAGAVYLDNRLGRGLFHAGHLDLLSRLADQAALALDTARLLARIESQRADLERLNLELERTVQVQRVEIDSVKEELLSTRSSAELRYRFEEMVGASASMLRVYHLIERLAPTKLPVLVVGESGTGKELIARALHSKSDRSAGPFFTVNCAALTETLLESELFGYRKGAFTGADRDKPGYFELAHRGTLFLDEIGDMGPAMQSKLLRALQEGEVLPVGGKAPIKVDVRIVSATNRDLSAMIRDGRFREDLYYRIHVGRIDVPALRERREDIPLLIDHFLGRLADEEGQPKREVEPAALRRLAGLDWRGNVRELHAQLLRVATFAKGTVLTLRDLERYGDLPALDPGSAVPTGLTGAASVESLEELERKQILLALEIAGGNKTKAAELLGINRATLFRKLKRFSL
jgi:transcriptional regulator with GAF, ATPase, and Fis domain/predicted ATPase